MRSGPEAAAAARRAHACFVQACALDVAVRKPGNVSLASPGHGMQARQFIASAEAAVGALCEARTRVGPRIEAAVAASWASAGCNTNLGIVLLCAPLALAAEQAQPPLERASMRRALQAVLQDLNVDDARCAYRAIARANPGGLGTAATEDVRSEPGVGLRQAMALAAGHDSIARQYVHGYADLFALDWPALPAPASTARPDAALTRAVQQLYLRILSTWPDSHIVRKRGLPTAQIVSAQAGRWLSHPQPDTDPAFEAWDQELKLDGLNPGTSADLTVATLMLAGLSGSPG